MSKKGKKKQKFGVFPFDLEEDHLGKAAALGLFRPDTLLEATDSADDLYGVAYDKSRNIAEQCGFQIRVQSSSTQRNSSGNAKYVCKKLHGQQYTDKITPADELECPFFVNVFGYEGDWKITRANFCHNHLLNVGFTSRPPVESTLERPATELRNTTRQISTATSLVEREMLPTYNGSTGGMTSAAIRSFLLSRGIRLSPSQVSRLKQDIDDRIRGDRLESFQKLEAYLDRVASENPGTLWRFEKDSSGIFKRAGIITNLGIHMALNGKKLYGFDGAHLKGEMNKYGVYLVATAKDFNNNIIPFGFALVPKESFEHWEWFLKFVKEALGDPVKFTAVSDRQKGLLAAVKTVFPEAGYRFCLYHILSNLSDARVSLTPEERSLVCKMAQSDCENDFHVYRSILAETKPRAVERLDAIPREHWVKYKVLETFNVSTYGEITSNLSEQANNWIGNQCRSAKPLDAFNLYITKVNDLAAERRQMAADWTIRFGGESLVPMLRKKRADLTQASQFCEQKPCMLGGYLVRFKEPVSVEGLVHPWMFVDLPAQTCTCGNWQDTLFPCVHAVYAAIIDGQDIDTLYDKKLLSVENFNLAYSRAFRPWPTTCTLARDTTLLMPPIVVELPERGKRVLKPGAKPKHKRKTSKRKA